MNQEASPVTGQPPRRREPARATSVDLAIVIGMAVIALAIVVGAFATTYAGRSLPDVVWTIPAGVVGAFGGALGMRNRSNGS